MMYLSRCMYQNVVSVNMYELEDHNDVFLIPKKIGHQCNCPCKGRSQHPEACSTRDSKVMGEYVMMLPAVGTFSAELERLVIRLHGRFAVSQVA